MIMVSKVMLGTTSIDNSNVTKVNKAEQGVQTNAKLHAITVNTVSLK